jgi:AcrR family transcriptional regulator
MSAGGDPVPTRERILIAAIDVMRRKGVAAATTKTIAAEAGISEALIYRYFKSKLEVLRAAVREEVGSAFNELLASLPGLVGTAAPAANVERVARAAIAFYRDLIPLLASLFSDNALIESYRSSLREHEGGPHRAVRVLGQYLAAEQQHGGIAPEIDPLAEAQMILGACFSHVFFGLTVGADRLPFDDDRLATAVARSVPGPGGRQENVSRK